MIKLLKDIGLKKSGEIVTFSKEIEEMLVINGDAFFVKIPEPCYKLK